MGISYYFVLCKKFDFYLAQKEQQQIKFLKFIRWSFSLSLIFTVILKSSLFVFQDTYSHMWEYLLDGKNPSKFSYYYYANKSKTLLAKFYKQQQISYYLNSKPGLVCTLGTLYKIFILYVVLVSIAIHKRLHSMLNQFPQQVLTQRTSTVITKIKTSGKTNSNRRHKIHNKKKLQRALYK